MGSCDPCTHTIDTTGSEGQYVRLLIKQGEVIKWAGPSTVNTGTLQLSYQTDGEYELQPNDTVCVQVSDDASFATILATSGYTIATANLGFVN